MTPYGNHLQCRHMYFLLCRVTHLNSRKNELAHPRGELVQPFAIHSYTWTQPNFCMDMTVKFAP